jgi:hypothetical protein
MNTKPRCEDGQHSKNASVHAELRGVNQRWLDVRVAISLGGEVHADACHARREQVSARTLCRW